ncbi:MAG: pyridoxal 5'-phosphate synthase glutaminase subunit PdxT [Candidatus Marinimicrobia bacterium]|jgi:5'-phosphate synthase pdxT subunit|nr:pyridoxal 5'-phosphate synthase glutaminase subunit PdxT [Candidatus Neomarinimicrobiota bacterium]MBT3676229.1 pyridoxal 5'-phosphate synthase glutaminase subunit PdxT [Candidatus Neomarinimicrobiota bacterium]MBT3763112.1 pyridoxal 5'-phosphate synthase glutaminase subunit PdxT [Candidatus Neomarinimicrobiota bacterium]MBT4067406.1 pyridoxal 5'-phosphate synthase glutaminase subunit PdxT [Candidatus Neomarinimicrobiota bacterium]MBT4270861.1 pyridoxal 5'-phosphate synthase glutaminase subu
MIGVLALQGDYAKHIQILNMLQIPAKEIRYPSELVEIKGLVIPGGESSTMTDLMKRIGFHEPLRNFAKKYPILGTCAGLIMMSSTAPDSKVEPLNVLDVEVDRNGYGRQIHSFTKELPVQLNGTVTEVPATFIRAPKITKVNNGVEIISEYKGNPVAVKQGHHLGLSFHPELDGITIFHNYIFKKQFQKTYAA